MQNRKISIIIPTFNEEENIEELISELILILDEKKIFFELLIMDDNSIDQTIPKVKAISTIDKRVKFVVRESDPGLSQSVVEGISITNSEFLFVMDADFSHPPKKIIEMYSKLCEGYDIVIGSRYIKKGKIENWSLKRHIISKCATILARLLISGVKDPVSGFFGFHRKVLSNANLKPKGYKILLEILGKGNYNSVFEIPIVFTERKFGKSKLKTIIIIDFISQYFNIFIWRLIKNGEFLDKKTK